MDSMAIIIGAALLVEALVQVFNGFVPESAKVPSWVWPLTSTCVGVILCVLGDIDLLAVVGLPLNAWGVGAVLTGCLVSRGASFVHDLWGNIQGQKPPGAPE